MTSADNIRTKVQNLVSPHIRSGDCLIITGYLNFFSSLAILMKDAEPLLKKGQGRYRIAFGQDTTIPDSTVVDEGLNRDEMRRVLLKSGGLSLLGGAKIGALKAADYIREGRIDIRIYDPEDSPPRLGRSSTGMMHAKVFTSPLGATFGSANFSRAGLSHNVEFTHMVKSGSAEYENAHQFSEQIWNACVDWNATALELLEDVFRVVPAPQAVRTITDEHRSFPPWMAERLSDVIGREPLPHQCEMVYEASSIVYEHGFVFLQAAAGSGKTDMGKLLAQTLGDTWDSIIPEDGSGKRRKSGSVAIVPAKVRNSWNRNKPQNLIVIKDTLLEKGDNHQDSSIYDRQSATETLRKSAVHILDESHRLIPSLNKEKMRTSMVEFSEPCWTVCLSATLLGNQDVDAALYLKETRASLFMSSEWADSLDQKMSDIRSQQDESAFQALDDDTKKEIVRLISPFMVIRQRADIGITKERRGQTYPPFMMHPKSDRLAINEEQGKILDEIIQKLYELGPGQQQVMSERGRMGNISDKRLSEGSLNARNLLNILRVSTHIAHKEMETGSIGEALRKVEAKRRPEYRFYKAKDIRDIVKSGKAVTPLCDSIEKMLLDPTMLALDEARHAEALAKVMEHNRLVILSERVETLHVLVKNFLAARERGLNIPHSFYIIASDNQESRVVLDEKEKKVVGFIREGANVEQVFGIDAQCQGPAVALMSYAMAEGINLQTADGLMFMGIPSNISQMIQGAARIDRIDSPHELSHYYINEVSIGKFSSDDKAMQRIRSNDLFRTGGQSYEELDDDLTRNLRRFWESPRVRKNNNLHDILDTIRSMNQSSSQKINFATNSASQISFIRSQEEALLLSLRGVSKRGAFSPPRFLKIGLDASIEMDQIKCARFLREHLGENGEEPGILDPQLLISQILSYELPLSRLRPWHLRPQRVVSLLRTAAASCDPYIAGNDGEPLFGHLSLGAIEFVAETWSRLLAPHWTSLKRELKLHSDSGAYLTPEMAASRFNEAQSHFSPDEIEKGETPRDLLLAAIDAADEIPMTEADDVMGRVSGAIIFAPLS